MVLSGALLLLNRVSRHGRNNEVLTSASNSGAAVRKSSASRATTAAIGVRTWFSYWSRRAWNQARSLLRLSERRNDRVFGVNTIFRAVLSESGKTAGSRLRPR